VKKVGLKLVVCVVLFMAFSVYAQEENPAEPEFDWQPGPTTGKLLDLATVEIPEGYAFLESGECRRAMKAMGNLVSNKEIGLIVAPEQWFMVFEFDEIGFVKDDDQDSLDAADLMKSFLENQDAANKMRSDQGMPESACSCCG